MIYTEYITQQGDTLPNIAWKAYGDPTRVITLFRTNPGLYFPDLSGEYPAGIKLIIEVLETEENETRDSLLPPWKRSANAS